MSRWIGRVLFVSGVAIGVTLAMGHWAKSLPDSAFTIGYLNGIMWMLVGPHALRWCDAAVPKNPPELNA